MNLEEMIDKYVEDGYEQIDAESKVAQDLILVKIANSSFSKSITIKGGIVMHNLSNDVRRATRDIDLDFIKYSLDDNSIRNFIDRISNLNDGIVIEIIGKIKPLHQQDYDGKRINILITDANGYTIKTKLDIGVHKMFDIKQEEFCFTFDVINENIVLLINSKEQIFVEKLKSLLKFGVLSTRYKDVLDFYYLINMTNINKEKVLEYIKILVFNDDNMKIKSVDKIIEKLNYIFSNERYLENLKSPKNNWLDKPINEVIDSVINFMNSLILVNN